MTEKSQHSGNGLHDDLEAVIRKCDRKAEFAVQDGDYGRATAYYEIRDELKEIASRHPRRDDE